MNPRWQEFWQQLQKKHRLVVMNDETLEEVWSFRLSKMNIYTAVSTLLVITALLVTLLIVYTPLKEYIPGYGDSIMKRKIMQVTYQSDSLEQVINTQNEFIKNIQLIISGNTDSIKNSSNNTTSDVSNNNSHLPISSLDTLSESEQSLRNEIERKENYRFFGTKSDKYEGNINGIYFLAPIVGLVTNGFNGSKNHFGIDIVAAPNEPIKAVADGVIILASWTLETGHTIAIQHKNNVVSFYKHNSVLLKKSGEPVKAGDAIAIIGNSGEGSNGPHLHFELWYNESPIDPKQYIDFE